MALVFDNQTSDGDSLIFPGAKESPYNANSPFLGGSAQIAIAGTFDGAIIEIHVDQDGATDPVGFISLVGKNQTQPDVNRIILAKGDRLKLVLTNAGASTDISASIVNV